MKAFYAFRTKLINWVEQVLIFVDALTYVASLSGVQTRLRRKFMEFKLKILLLDYSRTAQKVQRK